MKKSLVFSIDPKSHESLVVTLHEIKDDKWLPKRYLYLSVLLDLEKEHKDLIVSLANEKKRSLLAVGKIQSLETIDLSEIVINRKRSLAFLKNLAKTEKLYFNKERLEIDDLIDLRLSYRIKIESGGEYTLEGYVNNTYPILECDLICRGNPSFAIKEKRLQFFSSDLLWLWVKKVVRGQEILSHSDYERLLKDLKDDDCSPELIFEENLENAPEPLPVLFLKDPYGALADLKVQYGERIVNLSEPMEVWRHKETESLYKNDLTESGYKEKRDGEFYCPIDKVSETLTFLAEVGWRIIDHRGNQVICLSSPSLSLVSGKQEVLVKGRLSFEEKHVPLFDVLTHMKKNESFIELGGGFSGLLPKEALVRDYPGLLEGEICSSGVKIKKHDLHTVKSFLNSDVTCDESLRRLQNTLDQPFEQKPGAEFKGELRPYQIEGVGWLSFLYQNCWSGVLADDMGLGKTVQIIAFLTQLNAQDPILIVMPTSLLFNWQKELQKFWPDVKVSLYHGSNRKLNQAPIVLTSYSVLRQDIEYLEQIAFSCVVLDESQAIKNKNTQAAKSAFRLKSSYRLSVTGTPVENHLGELISHFHFLMPGFIEKDEDIERIKKKVRPFIMRRKKEEVAPQLPEKVEQVEYLEMKSEQKMFYEKYLAGFKSGLLTKLKEDGVSKHRMQVFEAILRLRQICCHPSLVDQSIERSVKFETLFSDLETIQREGQKVLVFSQFTSLLNIMAEKCRKLAWKYVSLDGTTKDREACVQKFQEDEETKIFFISIKAGGVGLNLTKADYVLLYDPWWNEAAENQAIDRAHRIGRQSTVIAKRYIVKDSIEEKIMELKKSKKTLSDTLFDTTDTFTLDELELLFE